MTTPATYCGGCQHHGKRLFASRKQARRHIRLMPPKQRYNKPMRPYECDALPGYWHIGHLPLAVLLGTRTAREVYGSD